MRNYDDFELMLTKIKKLQASNEMIMDLKGEAMKDRHWKRMLQMLSIPCPFNELTLFDLWDVDLQKNKKAVYDILTQAIGENALERFLTTIKEQWAVHELDLVKYQQKCRLIREWDELFALIDEHISNLASMKMSPYYKNFQDEISKWDERL